MLYYNISFYFLSIEVTAEETISLMLHDPKFRWFLLIWLQGNLGKIKLECKLNWD